MNLKLAFIFIGLTLSMNVLSKRLSGYLYSSNFSQLNYVCNSVSSNSKKFICDFNETRIKKPSKAETDKEINQYFEANEKMKKNLSKEEYKKKMKAALISGCNEERLIKDLDFTPSRIVEIKKACKGNGEPEKEILNLVKAMKKIRQRTCEIYSRSYRRTLYMDNEKTLSGKQEGNNMCEYVGFITLKDDGSGWTYSEIIVSKNEELSICKKELNKKYTFSYKNKKSKDIDCNTFDYVY